MSALAPGEHTILGHLAARARAQPAGAAFYAKVEGAWQATEWHAYADHVWRAARAFLAAGLEPGARVAIVSENRPEWSFAYLGAMAAGCVPVGIAPSLAADTACALMAEVNAAVVVLDRPRIASQLHARGLHTPRVIALFEDHPDTPDPSLTTWREFLSSAGTTSEDALAERLHAVAPETVAALVLTAGTTRPARAVELTHGNLAAATNALVDALELSERDRLLSYLPLAHPLEQLFSVHVPIAVGALVHYAESFARAAQDLRHVQPSVFVGVPQVFRQMQASVARQFTHTSGWQRALIDWSRNAATRMHARRADSRRAGLATRAAYRMADYLVLGKVKTALGLGNARLCISSTDTLPSHTRAFFASLDLPIHELYGHAETSYAVSVARPRAYAPGTVGEPLAGVAVRIVEPTSDEVVRDLPVGVGEIATRGAHTSQQTGDDQPWWRTGDLGYLDEHGRLVVVGRLDQCLRVGDRTVICEPLERALAEHPLIREAVLTSGRDGALGALLSLDPEMCDPYSSQPGVTRDPRELARDPELRAVISALLQQVSEDRAPTTAQPIIERFAVVPRELTVERGDLTPVLGVARAAVRARYSDRLDAVPDATDTDV